MCRVGALCQSVCLLPLLVWDTGCGGWHLLYLTPGSLPSSSGFLTSCAAELQELMKQIDIMVAHKKSEWEGQTQALEACLSAREQELSFAKAALQEKQKEVPLFHTVFSLESVVSVSVFYLLESVNQE